MPVLATALLAVVLHPAAQPSPARARFEEGQRRERAGDLAGAEAAYRETLRLAPRMAGAHDRLGFVLGQLGRTREALDEFRRAAEADPKLFDAQYHLGATLWWTGDPTSAVIALRKAVALD
ncbi:MAG TPA: tetratricopeptide repeat protein, partial [Vicinamibacteria bacterium]|nr:tetratricopeptide repeat protein [Vicinamibacteria bacterium]